MVRAGADTSTAGAAAPHDPLADPLADQITAMVTVEPSQRAELSTLADALAADWHREAGTDPDADAIVATLRRDLSDKLAAGRAGDPDAAIEIMRAEVDDRRVRALSRRSFALGKAVIDGAIADAAARAAGERILGDADALRPQIRALHDAERARRLSRDLEEVSLEASFAVARGPTSRRLSDYQAHKHAPGSPAAGAAPSVR